MGHNINPKLKAFVRVDGSGRVVPGTPVLQASKPKVGNWIEIPAYEGNVQTTTTTSTSTSTTTSTTTSTSTSTTTTTTTASPYTYYLANQYLCPNCNTPSGVNVVIKTTNPSLNAGQWLLRSPGGGINISYEILSQTTYDPMATLVDGGFPFSSCTCP